MAPAGALRHFWQALKRWKNAQLCEFFVLSANAARTVMHTARGSAIMFERFERMNRCAVRSIFNRLCALAVPGRRLRFTDLIIGYVISSYCC